MKSKLLIADDDLNNLIAIQAYMKDDFELFFANNGLEVVENINTINPDLILLDWKMPLMDGLETLKFLKNHVRHKEIPVIILTGVFTSDLDLSNAFKHGVIDFFKKPFNIDELKLKIVSIINLISNKNENLKIKSKELIKSEILNLNYNNNIQKLLKEINTSIQENSNNTDIQQELKKIKCNIVKELDKIKSSTNYKLQEINSDLIKNLTEKHPNMTSSELKLCALIRMNLGSKEIADISHQTYDSIRVARTRLRKKLNINKNETLISYLMKF
jgi:DNA-binding response OmpR family regulator